MMKKQMIPKASTLLIGAAMAVMAGQASAYNLISNDQTELNLDIEAVVGSFHSQETYGNPEGSPSWREAYLKYGLSGHQQLDNGLTVYGGLNAISAGNWGDGDASGVSNGNERQTKFEDAFAGVRNDWIDFSAGRQVITIGDGFIINDDALNFGEAIDPALSRGGAYWLAARKAFDQTAVLKLGRESGPRAELFWFDSDNKAKGRTEMAGINLEHRSDIGTFGALYLEGLGTDPTGIAGGAFDNLQRDGQKTVSVRYQGNAGVENLFLSAEFADQRQGDSSPDANAWYAEAGWTFADLPWQPTVNYRYSTFDEGYDELFTGFNRGYGTWFQGEVRANYAAGGPGNTDVDIHHIGIKATPMETLSVGALFFDFSDTLGGSGANDAQEINFYAEWVVNDHLIISPLLGFYTPDSASSTQGNDDTNTYFQVLAIVPF